MRLSLTHRGAILAALLALFIGTRTSHFDPLPDASVAVFFLAAFYVGRTRWLLPLLIVAAVLCDWITITGRGEDFWTHHCVSIAYWFLVPAYVSLWLAGRWLERRFAATVPGILLAGATLLAAFTTWMLFSNGSFYWLSGRYPQPHWNEFVARFVHYYPLYLRTMMSYVGLAAVVHGAVLLAARRDPHASIANSAK